MPKGVYLSIYPHTCAICSKPFETNRPQSKYCSPVCFSAGAKVRWNRNLLENKAKKSSYEKAHYAANREPVLARTKAYHLSEAGRAARRVSNERAKLTPEKGRAKSLRYLEKNRPAARSRKAAWAQQNPEKVKVGANRRRARRLNSDGSHTAADIREIFVAQRKRCAYCRIDLTSLPLGERHVDHIVALSRGGTNDRRNLQILCELCNLKKHAKHPLRFAREMGMLL